MRTSRCAAVGIVTELVNMHATLSIGVVTGDIVGDGGGRRLGCLFEGHLTCDFGVSSEDSDCSGMSALRWHRYTVDCKAVMTGAVLALAKARAQGYNSSVLAAVL